MVCVSGTNCTEDVKECDSSPCLYNGTCSEPQPNSYLCTCIRGIDGLNCQNVRIVTFTGEGPIVVRLGSAVQNAEVPRRKKRQVKQTPKLHSIFLLSPTLISSRGHRIGAVCVCVFL